MLCQKVAVYAKENVKKTSSKVYDSIREKVPKGLTDHSYASVCWSLFQDLIALLIGQPANWLSNGGSAKTVAITPVVAGRLLASALEAEPMIVLNRIEFSSLFDLVVCSD